MGVCFVCVCHAITAQCVSDLNEGGSVSRPPGNDVVSFSSLEMGAGVGMRVGGWAHTCVLGM